MCQMIGDFLLYSAETYLFFSLGEPRNVSDGSLQFKLTARSERRKTAKIRWAFPDNRMAGAIMQVETVETVHPTRILAAGACFGQP